MCAFRTSRQKSDGPAAHNGASIAKVVLASTVLAVAGSTMTAGPAMASESVGGCTITAKVPKESRLFGVSADYPIHVKCEGGRKAVIVQERYDRDDDGDVLLGQSTFEHMFWFSGETTVWSQHAVDLSDHDEKVNVFHKVKFYVVKDSKQTPTTEWDESPVREITFF